MNNKPAPSGAVAGIAAVVVFGSVILAAVGLFAYRNAGDYLPSSNTNRELTRQASTPYTLPAQAPPATGEGIKVSPLPTPYINNSETAANANMPTLINANSSDYLRNSNSGTMYNGIMSNTNHTRESRYNGRVIEDECYLWSTWKPTDDYIEQLGTGDRLIIIRRSNDDRTMFYVETESGNKGWMNGNDIEYVK